MPEKHTGMVYAPAVSESCASIDRLVEWHSAWQRVAERVSFLSLQSTGFPALEHTVWPIASDKDDPPKPERVGTHGGA